MAKYHIIVDNPNVEHRQALSRGHQRSNPRPKGAVHAEAVDEACPNGLPNCRNCGDPAFIDSCRARGHCPDCGTKHGIAPDSILIANGYKIQEVPANPSN